MEYEIDDDPQGDYDTAEGDRTGGVKEDFIQDHRRREAPKKREKGVQPA